jgi:hypothetical protein
MTILETLRDRLLLIGSVISTHTIFIMSASVIASAIGPTHTISARCTGTVGRTVEFAASFGGFVY